MESILVFDDETDMLENVHRALTRQGYRCVTSNDPSRVAQLLEEEQPDLVITDLKMPGQDGLDVLRAAKNGRPGMPVVVCTAFATVETAVEAMKLGALDYIPKPFTNDQLIMVVEKALREKRLRDENLSLRQKLGVLFGLDKVVGTSVKLREVLETVKKIAATDANVLITGESGTGKELVARVLHMNSKRKEGPFVPVDCASLPEALLESELFGHEKGAFTDAYAARPGIFEYAQAGTIFLDEIGDMPLPLQVKLFRVLQERQVRRLGANKLVSVDVRVVSATNKELKREVEEKRFREELYFRLNVVTISLPPLREREGDVPVLARHFVDHFARIYQRAVTGIAPEAMRLLEAYPWPGNVRELQNVMERAIALSEGGAVEVRDLPESLTRHAPRAAAAPANGQALPYKEAKRRKLDEFHRDYLNALLAHHKGNVSRAAEQAGIDRKTIHRVLRRLNRPSEV